MLRSLSTGSFIILIICDPELRNGDVSSRVGLKVG